MMIPVRLLYEITEELDYEKKLDFINDKVSNCDAEIILDKLEKYIKLNNITFVSGTRKKKIRSSKIL